MASLQLYGPDATSSSLCPHFLHNMEYQVQITTVTLLLAAIAIIDAANVTQLNLHSGVHFQNYSTKVYRGFKKVVYVQDISLPPELQDIPQLNVTCKDNIASDVKHPARHVCSFLNVSSSLQNSLKAEILELVRYITEPDVSTRKKRSVLDALRWFGDQLFGSQADSNVEKVVSAEKKMDERLRELRYRLSNEAQSETDVVQGINAWGADVTKYLTEVITADDDLDSEVKQLDDLFHRALAVIAAQGANISIQLMALIHVLRERSILADCRRGTIPFHAISLIDFQMYLRNVSNVLEKQGQKLAIDPDNIESFVNEQLASCKLSKRSFHLSINLPVLYLKDTGYEVFLAKPLDFVWENEQCRLLQEPKLILWNHVNSQMTVLSPLQGRQCLSGGLCRIPRLTYAAKEESCLKGLLSGLPFSDVKTLCLFQCDRNPPLSRITRILDNLFSISSYSTDVYLLCNGRKTLIVGAVIGAKTLTVPCECSLIDSGTTLISPELPCTGNGSQTLTETIQLPALWSKDPVPNFSINWTTEVSVYKHDVTESVDKDWKKNVPHINLVTPGYEESEGSLWSELDLSPSHLSVTSIVWNLILTCIFIYIMIKAVRFYKDYKLGSKLASRVKQHRSAGEPEAAEMLPVTITGTV